MAEPMTLVDGDGQSGDTYTVSLELTCVQAGSPRHAVDVFASEIGEHGDRVYTVTNEQTGDRYTIDQEGDGEIRVLGADAGPPTRQGVARVVVRFEDILAPELLEGVARQLAATLIERTDVVFTLRAEAPGAMTRGISRTRLRAAGRAA
jgi:hypothetical protein